MWITLVNFLTIDTIFTNVLDRKESWGAEAPLQDEKECCSEDCVFIGDEHDTPSTTNNINQLFFMELV